MWRRKQIKKTKEQITAIYNHSNLTLTEAMKKILNRGLNFCVSPLTLNITNILVEYRKYERTVKWVEFFADKDTESDSDTESNWKKEIFPQEK
jgi:hypothetical protein